MKITIEGKSAFLYSIGIGEYSDYRGEWWYHEREMTRAEMLRLLIKNLGALSAVDDWIAKREAFSRERFGCAAEDIGWDLRPGPTYNMRTPRGTYEDFEEYRELGLNDSPNLREIIMLAAGFVRLEEQAGWGTYDPYLCGENAAATVERYVESIRNDLERAELDGSRP